MSLYFVFRASDKLVEKYDVEREILSHTANPHRSTQLKILQFQMLIRSG